MTAVTSADADRRRIAVEVLELGETLFDALLDAAADPDRAEASEALPEGELRTAAGEFFHALRVLLVLDEGPSLDPDNGSGQGGG
jgi:DNA-binding MarR family transcriptional regulator